MPEFNWESWNQNEEVVVVQPEEQRLQSEMDRQGFTAIARALHQRTDELEAKALSAAAQGQCSSEAYDAIVDALNAANNACKAALMDAAQKALTKN